ncbi:LPXTG-motif cell wall anchor domain protein [Streptococcus oralis]|uniref:LPXTG-motif cell wall anchor domain protein n=1 Tax=Streptococcus oralis TaxID=1303 RepID=A0A081R3Y2_STROR|nr:FctA domain-containing protein [Streptococcus oralis]KEQ49905.1 LPXTG-motif cell wall anchor domain protein [Streptococcus oralis]
MKKRTSKLFRGLMALLLVVSVFLPALRLNGVVSAAEKTESEYTLTTEPTINTNRLVDHAKYGEGKFYLKTTYAFPDNVTLNNGDFMVYHVPNEFKIEVDSTTDLKAPNGETIASLTTEKATNTAKITVTNEEYFKKFNENKQIVASFTVVWADHVEKNKEYEINIPGAGVYHLTRIVPDVDPTGFTKWGVQDSDDPNYVNWRIRVNRYAKSYTGVNIQDTIPDGQVLASEITGYYFPDWENGYGRTKLDSAHVQVTDKNHFSITPNGDGTLDHKGLFILYRTRLTKPVDQVTKRVLNNVSVTTNEEAQPIDFEGFAPITTTDGIGGGAKSDEVALEVTKKLEGKTLEKDAFSFQLLDDKGNILQTVKNDENGKVKFEAIKYKEAGTFKYTIKEVNDNKPGYTYDANVLKATVTVEDVLGEKLASVKFEDSKKEFTNTYAAKEAKLQLEAKKVLNGKAIEAGQFEFELKENGTVLHTVSNDAKGKIQFPELTFTKEETRTFTITEKAGDVAGVEYDPNAYEVTVVVKDNGQGQLVATATGADNLTFTNVYKAKPAKETITATKVLNGKALEADKYEFELKEGDKVVATAKNAADGTVTFPAISYDAAGPHTYTITEKAGSEAGVTYDKTSHTVTVDVKDNGQGQLVATVTDNNPTFTNTYKAAPAKATITAKKVLDGKALEADKYEFELKEGDKVVATAKNAADGTVTFKEIEYKEAGDHTYTISEKAGSEGGVTYDTATHEVTVNVTDNGQGQLVAAVTGNNPTFTNTYKAASAKATITAKKVLNGKALEAGKYEFELKEGDKVVDTATNAADGTVTFKDIEYAAVENHTYTISEKAGSEGGVTYDTAKHEVKVAVTDNGQGQLVAAVTGNNPTFTNTYKAASAKATITAKKALNGKALEADKYEFELKEGDKVVATAKNAADGTVTFEAIEYAVAGDHTYTITEKAGSEGGVTYDTATHEVTVNVTDNGQGQLEAAVTGNNPTFTNTYKAASAKATITATKVLDGKALEAGKYEFELKEGDEVVATAKNAADGTVTFEDIKYAAAGNHTYTITEKAGSEAGVTYDTAKHEVTVNVTDNGQGQLVATVTGNNPTFTNTYKAASAKATITATKVLTGKALEADKYEFELKEGDKVVATAKNAADGTVTFEAIEYAAAGNHTYTITEKAGSEAGVTYDTAKHEVKVAVTDNGTGQLEAAVTGNNPTFTNTYKAASTTVNITATKVLTGKALEAGKYEFELKEGDKVIGTATNAADGTVAFAGIEYKEAGSHTYTISEKAGSEAGVTYDKSTHNVTVNVTDNGAGKLVATVTDNNPTFTNTYVASSTQVTFTAKKVLKGDKKLVEGQFKFELKEGDKVVETATNAADGTVTFKAIKYNEAGKHTYTITEVDSKEENVTYDTAKHEVTVEVVDNGTGQLVTTVTGNNPTFTNTYTEPKKEEPKEGPKGEQPKKDLPNTGGADFTAFSTILGLVLAALAGLVYRAKKVD